ncbi:type II toxin-antitoxin system death-on-curing family toxin [Paucilactobacillus kaifaensis]|uniref:type II toxin-antitoxin system death-on-curing family toxin n=1 Tax=Paucilactobacillus kaifaensis TaxID=2559921 RepID=UPI0010F4718D|nr:type II toxin-antitoxin system death-on-curing family toxin [Paucilactobacillus kaifaensis]
MAKVKYLSKSQLLKINQYAVEMVGGKSYGVQSAEALDVVIEQPQQIIFGHELYPTIWLKAAFILQKITKKHVFIDGNKRTSIQAALYFLNLNGYQLVDNKVVNESDGLILAVTNSPDNEETMKYVAEWLESIHQ